MADTTPPLVIPAQDMEACIRVLEAFHDNLPAYKHSSYKPLRKAMLPFLDDIRSRMFHGNDMKTHEQKKFKKQERKRKVAQAAALDRQFINNTQLRKQRIEALDNLIEANSEFPQIPDGAVPMLENEENKAIEQKQLKGFRSCYVCKKRYDCLHHFYDQLCPECALLNFEKRYKALVTGARVKIGYHTALKLLRANAVVIATSRFPHDAAIRYAKEVDYDTWKDRLHVFGMDLRDLAGVESFMTNIGNTFGWIDIVINNATQTIRRPTVYYQHLLENERTRLDEKPEEIRSILKENASFQLAFQDSGQLLLGNDKNETTLAAVNAVSSSKSAEMSQLKVHSEDHVTQEKLFPTTQYDMNQQQVDLRSTNSWKLKIDQVESPELAEVFAINTLAPFILNKRAITLFGLSPNTHKFIINVSAMEGKFYRYKTPHHPHTNMAKAAVNMMTRTCAEDLQKQNIYMNSVDTGWINDENPREKAEKVAKQHNFQTPLDEIDAAARILDPIFSGYQSNPHVFAFGQFFKDYQRSECFFIANSLLYCYLEFKFVFHALKINFLVAVRAWDTSEETKILMGRVIIRRWPFDAPSPSRHPWGPPSPSFNDESMDMELFSIYFVITETLATFLWFAIANHCLEGTRVPFLSPAMRCCIGIIYAAAKLYLLQYAFRQTFYLHMTIVVTIICFGLAAIAFVWHRGPFWFFFFVKPLRVFQPYYSINSFVQHIRYVVLQGLVPVPMPMDTTTPSSLVQGTLPSSSVQGTLSKLHVHVDIQSWNGAMIEHWRVAILDYGLDQRTTRDDLPYYETRLLFAMQADGLLISFYLMPPTPSLVLDLYTACNQNNIYEIVLRYLRSSSSSVLSTPLMYYADNPISSGKSTIAQRAAIKDVLQRFNVNCAIGNDIPVRLLKCNNFINAGIPKATKRRVRKIESKFTLD
ncbi:hypothetical protein THRCLA_05887 [Thraustotheca clavata]|uniref:Oxidoreductase n=1 Tax=Thraustotheca clavata TaxID=74557 RepID=A0A1V9ZRR7_9STRA|nr:hypothetical protein THRCLA_05887 [Thraustotheca clavata]